MAQQEGLERYRLKDTYYDMLLVGRTGQGKSTTADKLLIANPEGLKYDLPERMEATTTNNARVRLEDISMWLLDEKEDEKKKSVDLETHLKALVYFRTSDAPHNRVNGMRGQGSEILTNNTAFCQVFSNDTTKVRVLDVPGFYDSSAFKSPASSAASSARIVQCATDIASSNLCITRNIIRIQAALGMCFRRVLYFLPSRGPLERFDALLKSELQYLELAFGRPVFECMVAVATVPTRSSLKKEADKEKFPREDVKQCEGYFQKALRDVLGVGPDEEEPKVPVIFISLSESCESILGKVQGARVTRDQLELKFNPSTCANCGVRIGSLDEERVTCSMLQDPDGVYPYEESTCHPFFRRSLLSHILGRKITKMIAAKWPSYKEEFCVNCEQRPFEPGCLQVKQTYKWWGKVYVVDHTSEITEPVDAAAEGEPPTSAPGGRVGQSVRADQLGSHQLGAAGEGGGRCQAIVVRAEAKSVSLEDKKGT